MCIKVKKGIKINKLKNLVNKFEYFFGEDQGRYLIEIKKENLNPVKEILNKSSVHFDELGIVDENIVSIDGELNYSIEELKDSHKKWLRNFMVN